MQIESLKVFCDVARCRSFSQAAAVNHLTQSAASQTVRQIEEHLGVQLVDRSTRPLQLTSLGQRYYEGCRELVDHYLELESTIRTAQAELESTIEVAAIYSVGLGDMGKVVERFHAASPNVRVHVEYLHPDRVYEKVLEGTADLGLVSYPRPSRKWEVIPWREEPMVVACAPSHRFAGLKAVSAGDLDGEAFVAFDRGLTIRRHIDRYLRDHGAVVRMTCEFDSIENIKKAVEESAGVAVLPEPTFRREARAGALAAVPLADGDLVRPVGIIRRRHQRPSGSACRFVQILQQGNGHSAAGRSADGRSSDGRAAHEKTPPRGRNGFAGGTH